jgi:hypothetical protein
VEEDSCYGAIPGDDDEGAGGVFYGALLGRVEVGHGNSDIIGVSVL